MCPADSPILATFGAPASVAMSGLTMVDDPGVLWLRVEAALTLVPLISKVVITRADRRAVLAAAVDRWLGLQDGVRDRYCRIAGSDDGGLESFCWDFVDKVEQGMPWPSEGGQPGGPESQPITAEAAEEILIRRWCQYLQSYGSTQTSD